MIDEGPSYSKMANGAAPWVTIGSAVVAVCSFFILLGMWLGPQKDIPTQLTTLLARVDSVDGRLSKIEWANDSQKTQINLLGNQMSIEAAERNKVAVSLQDLKSIVDTIKANYLQREIFIEWKADYEARTRTPTPQIRRNN